LQRAAFGRKSDNAASRFPYLELCVMLDELVNGVIIGQAGAEQQLENNKQSYATDIVNSAAFIAGFLQL
jgi:hypothetical protein